MNQLMKMGMYANQVASAPPALVEYLSASHPSSNLTANKYSQNMMRGQSFQCGVAGELTKAVGYMYRDGTATGNAEARIYSHTGTFGSGGVGATLLATSAAIAKSTIGTSNQLVTFTFPAGVNLTYGTYYVVEFVSDSNGALQIGVDYNTGATGTYVYQEPIGSAFDWGDSYDILFYVYVKA